MDEVEVKAYFQLVLENLQKYERLVEDVQQKKAEEKVEPMKEYNDLSQSDEYDGLKSNVGGLVSLARRKRSSTLDESSFLSNEQITKQPLLQTLSGLQVRLSKLKDAGDSLRKKKIPLTKDEHESFNLGVMFYDDARKCLAKIGKELSDNGKGKKNTEEHNSGLFEENVLDWDYSYFVP